MAELRKYATATHIYIPIVKRGVIAHAVSADWTPAAGDVKISIDGGTAANVTNLPTAIAMGNSTIWDFSLTSGELTGAKILVTVADSATKAVEDTGFAIETFGNASAQYAVDLSDSVRAGLTALPNAAAGANGGLPLGDANARVDVIKVAGTTQTARDLGAQLDATVTSRMASFTLPTNFATLSINGSGLVDITQAAADKVWSTAARTLTSFGSLVANIWDALLSSITTSSTIGKLLKDNVDATVSSRLATSGYTAPDNTSIAAIKTQTDKFVFTIANRLDVQVKGMDVSSVDAAALATDAVTEIATAIAAIAIDGSYTLQQALEIIAGAVAGKLSGGGTGTIVIRNIADTKNLLTTTVDATGRLTVTINA